MPRLKQAIKNVLFNRLQPSDKNFVYCCHLKKTLTHRKIEHFLFKTNDIILTISFQNSYYMQEYFQLRSRSFPLQCDLATVKSDVMGQDLRSGVLHLVTSVAKQKNTFHRYSQSVLHISQYSSAFDICYCKNPCCLFCFALLFLRKDPVCYISIQPRLASDF